MAMQLVITLAEAATGVEKEIVLDRLATCDVCGGSGSADGSGVTTCPDCGGTRPARRPAQDVPRHHADGCAVRAVRRDRPHRREPVRGVPGLGTRARPPARQRRASRPVSATGSRFGCAGWARRASAVPRRATCSSPCESRADEYLHREGDDLHCRATVTITQAALGAELNVDGVLEENDVDVPAGTQHGDTVRVKGAGMPRLNSTAAATSSCTSPSTCPRSSPSGSASCSRNSPTSSATRHAEHKSPVAEAQGLARRVGRRCRRTASS